MAYTANTSLLNFEMPSNKRMNLADVMKPLSTATGPSSMLSDMASNVMKKKKKVPAVISSASPTRPALPDSVPNYSNMA